MKCNRIRIILGIILFAFICLLAVRILIEFQKRDTYDSAMEGNIVQQDLPDTVNQPNEDNDDESVEPFIDEELYLYIKRVYEEVDWDIQFLPGDESKRDLCREQFIKLLKEEIPVVDEERGYETTLSHFGEIAMDTDYQEYAPDHYSYYFCDVDGDGTPELGMTNNQRFVYIFKYEEETDRIVIWDEYYLGISLMGTGKFHWSGSSNDYGMMGLDQNGDYIFLVRFRVEGSSKYEGDGNDGQAYFVALPDYVEMEDRMLSQATYKDVIYENYFFRVTKEQYDELEGQYLETVHESYREIEEVIYTYDELLNLR